jgi:hypothetical protein
MAERAAEETARISKQGWTSIVAGSKGLDEKYKIGENTSAGYNKAKAGIMGLFG